MCHPGDQEYMPVDTLNWYCDGPEPTEAACRYDRQVRKCKLVILAFLFSFLSEYLVVV